MKEEDVASHEDLKSSPQGPSCLVREPVILGGCLRKHSALRGEQHAKILNVSEAKRHFQSILERRS